MLGSGCWAESVKWYKMAADEEWVGSAHCTGRIKVATRSTPGEFTIGGGVRIGVSERGR